MTAKLVTHELGNDRTFEVGEGGITIGRHDDNVASLDDARLSRFHARIVFRGGAWFAEDLGSTNGSFVNGEKFEGERQLQPGDKLRFGATDAEFSWDAAAPSAPVPPPPAPSSPFPQPAAVVAPDSKVATPAATSIAPAAEPVKKLVITPASPADIASLDAPSPAAPAAPASPVSPIKKPLIRKPVIGGALKPGLKLPPKQSDELKPGLKLPPKPAGLKPGLKLPAKPVLKPGLKLPPKPGAGGAGTFKPV